MKSPTKTGNPKKEIRQRILEKIKKEYWKEINKTSKFDNLPPPLPLSELLWFKLMVPFQCDFIRENRLI